MTPSDIDSINRRMAEACGWKFRKRVGTWVDRWILEMPELPRDQFGAIQLRVQYGKEAPKFTTDCWMYADLIEQEMMYSHRSALDDQWVVGIRGGFWGNGETLAIAFCLAYLARHDARRGEG